MDLIIQYQCPYCGINKEWVYREDEGLKPKQFLGCPGNNCQITHDLAVKQITSEQDEERAQKILDGYPSHS